MKEQYKESVFKQMLTEEDVTAEQVLKQFKLASRFARPIRAAEVLGLIRRTEFDYTQLGEVLDACTSVLLRIRERKADDYDFRIPQMHQYRIVREYATKAFDIGINRE